MPTSVEAGGVTEFMANDLGVLAFLFDDGRSVAIGTWFFVEAGHLSPPLPPKEGARSVVASKVSDALEVVVFPRSKSRPIGVVHSRHLGHECSATAIHEHIRSHECHVNLPGRVDFDTPITLAIDLLVGRKMCFEDEDSELLALLEDGLV